MRIYEGSPRQDWEEVLRSIGAFADSEGLKDLLLLERPDGFVLQGIGLQAAGADSDSFGTATKRTIELSDDRVAELMEVAAARQGTDDSGRPVVEATNYYELALRILGAYIDSQRPHDAFFFEQDGSFVVRLFAVAGSGGIGHQLSEFTRDELLAMIQAAPEQRDQPGPETTGPQ